MPVARRREAVHADRRRGQHQERHKRAGRVRVPGRQSLPGRLHVEWAVRDPGSTGEPSEALRHSAPNATAAQTSHEIADASRAGALSRNRRCAGTHCTDVSLNEATLRFSPQRHQDTKRANIDLNGHARFRKPLCLGVLVVNTHPDVVREAVRLANGAVDPLKTPAKEVVWSSTVSLRPCLRWWSGRS